jgi:Telomerase ribonucleoprotein complex - RNA binding domain
MISECDQWLGLPSRASKCAQGQRRSVSDANKRRELLEEFLYWFFEGFVLPLLKVGACPIYPTPDLDLDVQRILDNIFHH